MHWSRAVFAIGSSLALACTFIVDGQLKDYSDKCQVQGIGDTLCGQCLSKNCQKKIDGLCTSYSTVSNVSSCAKEPNPGRDWNCSNLMGAGPLDATPPQITEAQNELNHCAAGCMDDCTKCTSIDFGTGACGACIKKSCADLLNGNDGCCDNSTVVSGIAKAVAPFNNDCVIFTNSVGNVWEEQDATSDGSGIKHDAGFESCKQSSSQEFALCVVTGCATECKCQ